jgi:hypothetical protein
MAGTTFAILRYLLFGLNGMQICGNSKLSCFWRGDSRAELKGNGHSGKSRIYLELSGVSSAKEKSELLEISRTTLVFAIISTAISTA